MTPQFKQALRTALAASFITAWACASLMTDAPAGVLNYLIFAGLLVQQEAKIFTQPIKVERSSFLPFAGLIALIGSAIALTVWAGEEATAWFMHSIFLVLPAWTLMMWGIVRRSAAAVSTMPTTAASPMAAHPMAPRRTPADR
jgi:hypothetical protein